MCNKIYGYNKYPIIKMDCKEYNNCATMATLVNDFKNRDTIELLAVGCWGVYCNQGQYTIKKIKDGKNKDRNSRKRTEFSFKSINRIYK